MALRPPATRGGNGRHLYADTESVRAPMPPGGRTGWLPRLRDAWGRYPGVRLAAAEAPIGCTEGERVRWLVECRRAVEAPRAEGAGLRAVTVRTLFGAADWCSLPTRRTGRYEPGAFDVGVPGSGAEAAAHAAGGSGGGPRPRGAFDRPLLREPGWWGREDRVHAALRRTG